MNVWALSGLAVFGLFAFLGLGDGVSLWPGLAAEQYGEQTELVVAAPIHSLLSSLLSLVIGLTAGLTLFWVLQGKRQRTAGASRLVGYSFMVYGLYQLVMAVARLSPSPLEGLSTGIMFVLIGFFVIWLGRRVARAL